MIVVKLIRLPCDCVCDIAQMASAGRAIACPWCGAEFSMPDWCEWLSCSVWVYPSTPDPPLVRFGAQVLQAAGQCRGCGSLLARCVRGVDVVFHMSEAAALDVVRLWN